MAAANPDALDAALSPEAIRAALEAEAASRQPQGLSQEAASRQPQALEAASQQAQEPIILQQAMDPLAELRDIHLPGPIAAWPPAPGWWALAFLACLALGWFLAWFWRRWQAARYRREALAELDALLADWRRRQDSQGYLTALQGLLKRTALTGFPRAQVASLTGEAWVTFLDRSAGMHGFSTDDAEALIDGSYRRDFKPPVERLHRLAATWVQAHHPRHLQEAPPHA